jgi:hypothetical protein
MNSVCRLLLTAVFVVALAAPGFAQSISTGAIHLTVDGAGRLDIEFNVRGRGDGAEGQMVFSGAMEIHESEDLPPGTSRGVENLQFLVDFDCLTVAGNRAAMSGLVRGSSRQNYVGQRVILAVEDGGEGSRAEPDRFTWGVYGLQAITWLPTDAELDFDNGWKFTWIATDAERPDDRGVANKRTSDVDCRSFPLADYTFVDIPLQGSGNVQVRP